MQLFYVDLKSKVMLCYLKLPILSTYDRMEVTPPPPLRDTHIMKWRRDRLCNGVRMLGSGQ